MSDDELQLTPQVLIYAYAQGVFPMAHGDEIYWYDPDPRAVLPLDGFHLSRSLERTMKRVRVVGEDGRERYFVPAEVRKSNKPEFLVTVNRDFRQVIRKCAEPRGTGTWIDERILEAYVGLHEAGFAHSVETWRDGELIGGLYGVHVNGLFAGESMFSRATDASKVALVYLVERMKVQGLVLLDVQFQTDHLSTFGVVEISRSEYKRRLGEALRVNSKFV